MTMLARRFGGFALLLLSLSLCRPASAHPMGNFSVNHYSKITLDRDRIRIHYLIDLAEIPTYQELQQANISATASRSEFLHRDQLRCCTRRGTWTGLILDVDGKVVPLHLISSGVIFPPGAGGLPTMKMGFVYDAVYPSTLDRRHIDIHFVDNNYPGHTGWKEITALASLALCCAARFHQMIEASELSKLSNRSPYKPSSGSRSLCDCHAAGIANDR